MLHQSFILLIIAGINLLLAIFVYLRNRESKSNFYYSMMVFVGSLWILGLFGYSISSEDPVARLFFTQLTYIFTLITSFYYFIFTYHFPYKIFQLPKPVFVFLYLFVFGYSLYLAYNTFSLIDDSVILTNIEHLNFLQYTLFSLVFLVFIVSGIIILLKKFLQADGVIKKNLKYVLIATVLTYLLASITNLFSGFFYEATGNNFLSLAWSQTYWLGPVFSLINVSVIGWILFKKY